MSKPENTPTHKDTYDSAVDFIEQQLVAHNQNGTLKQKTDSELKRAPSYREDDVEVDLPGGGTAYRVRDVHDGRTRPRGDISDPIKRYVASDTIYDSIDRDESGSISTDSLRRGVHATVEYDKTDPETGDGVYISYSASKRRNDYFQDTEVAASVERQKQDPLTGKLESYKHTFKSPEAVGLVAKLAMKQVQKSNSSQE